jgi:hypothetical protein
VGQNWPALLGQNPIALPDDIARLQRRHQNLLDIGQEQFSIDCAIDDEWSGQAVAAQRADKGGRLPMSMRNGSNQAMTTFCPAIAPGHVGLHPGFINENEFRWSQLWLLLAPFGACLGNVLTRLLGSVEGLFLKVRPSAASVLFISPVLAETL